MKPILWTALAVLSATSVTFACTCVSAEFPEVPACLRVKAKRTSLFVGKVAHIDMKTILIPPDNYPVPGQVVSFEVQETFGRPKEANLVVSDWAASNGSCGFPFTVGNTYLVDTFLDRNDNSLHAAGCGYTTELTKADDLVRFLRSIEHDDSASLFGTVKEYVGEKNFVSPLNKPVSGAKLSISSADVEKEAVTDNAGWFFVNGLSSGEYTVHLATSAEYTPSRAQPVKLSTDGCAQIDFRVDHATREP